MAGWVNATPDLMRISLPTHKRLEQNAQAAVIAWARLHEVKYPALKYLIAIPNGAGRLSIRAAAALKKAGVKAGPSDLFLPSWGDNPSDPEAQYPGLWLEMKVIHRRPHPTKAGIFQVRKGIVSQEQKDWLEGMVQNGYASAVAWCPEEAQSILERYVRGEWVQGPIAY